ncbi:MAG: hypothetical protein K0S65_3008 [Labilithrix sp.]|nr:hypothetical protein [Labilithrix sp.]
MRRAPRFWFACIGIGAAVALIVACSSDRGTGFHRPPDLLPDAGESSPPDAMACGRHCSRDIKSVLEGCDADEHVVETCGVDKGCGEGNCIEACQAVQLSKGSVGCEFWTLPADDGRYGKGSCFAAMVANTWDRPVTVSADYGVNALDISKSIFTVDRAAVDKDPTYTPLVGALPPGQVAIVFLAQAPDVLDADGTACPPTVTPALLDDPLRHGSSRTNAFHLKTDAPISAYSIFPYGGASSYYPSATLLLPVSSWEKDYVAVSPSPFGHQSRRTLQIVAGADETVVSIRPNVQIVSGNNVEGAPAGAVHSWTLARGEVLQFTQTSLTGSPISTTKPVGVFGGAECAYVPGAWGTCDLLQQQIPPTAQWGTEYALVPFPPRTEGLGGTIVREQVPYAIVGAVDGTQLTYEPSRPLGAPETLNAGESVGFITDNLLVVRSQDASHPFYASVYMTGAQFGGGAANGRMVSGDPDFVNIPPSDQFLDRYVFFTDYTYPETRLTVVRRKTKNGFAPVVLECAGELDNFQPLGTSGEYEYAWVSLTKGYVGQQIGQGQCAYGRQEAHSDGPFSVTVWGIGEAASYGYAGGTGLRPINDVVPEPLR